MLASKPNKLGQAAAMIPGAVAFNDVGQINHVLSKLLWDLPCLLLSFMTLCKMQMSGMAGTRDFMK